MSAVETLRAAISRLEEQRAAAMLGPWQRATWSTWGTPAAAVTAADDDEVGYPLNDGDADLIVTLHRTIDAQLAVLRNALGWASDTDAGGTPDEPESGRLAFALAQAILGETAL